MRLLALLVTMLVAGPVAESPVADAAQRNDVEAVRTLLRSGADVNAAQGDGMSALHWAASNGRPDVIDVLLYAGANPEATTRLGGYTALHLASRAGQSGAVQRLLEGGANALARTGTGVTALHYAAAAGRPDAVAALLAHGAEVDGRAAKTEQTPLMWATAYNRLDAMRALLDAGADVAVTNAVVDYVKLSEKDRPARQLRQRLVTAQRAAAQGPEDETPAAERPERAGAAQPGAQRTARPEPGEPPAAGQPPQAPGAAEKPPEAGTPPGATPPATEQAAQEPAAAEKPAEGEKPAEAEKPAEGEKPAEAEKPEVAGAEPPGGQERRAGAQRPTEEEQTPEEEEEEERALGYNDLVGREGGFAALHFASRDGRTEAAHLLLEYGADLDQPTAGDGTTPLLMATINGNFDLAMDYLERGADPNLVAEDGVAPLFMVLNRRWGPKAAYPQPSAFQQQHTDYLELMTALIQAGADVNHRTDRHVWYTSFNFDQLGVDFSGATAFWRAAYATDVDAMKLLIRWGADPNIATRKTPARRFGPRGADDDKSGLPPVPTGAPAVWPIHAASGVGYGEGFAANSHSHAPDSWLPAVRYLVEEHGADVNARDHNGYSPVHHAAARGDNELIEYLVSKGADVTFVSRRGETTVDMANGPRQRVQPFPATIALLEGLGAVNNHNCQSC